MLPEHYEPQHHAQQISFEGADLAGMHRHAVLASANWISINSIRCVNDTQFRIESQSNLRRFYLVDIKRQICNYLDFPRLQFCKHLCTVKIQYPFIPPFERSSPDLPRSSPISSQIAATSGEWTHHPSILSGLPSGALPNRDCLSPNQNLWVATAKWMGVKMPPKQLQRQIAVAAVPMLQKDPHFLSLLCFRYLSVM